MKISLSFIILSIALTACSTTTPQKKQSTEEMAKAMLKEPSPLEKRRYTNFVNAEKNEKAGNTKKAFELYLKSALEGYKPAFNEVGHYYYYGKGVKQNYSKAAYWAEKAPYLSADGGVTLHNLGQLYRQGKGVNKDYKKAIKYYQASATIFNERAAKYGLRGYAPAQNNLAFMYENGMGTSKDIRKAKSLYTKSAKQGYKLAIKNLKRLKEAGL